MADILTQMQDEVDMLLNIMQSQLFQVRARAPPSVPVGQARVDSFAEKDAKERSEANNTTTPGEPAAPPPPAPPTPAEFAADIKDMARDLVLKQQQLELLIASLPGLHSSEVQQVAKMKELEGELAALEVERLQAVKEREELVRVVEGRISGVGRVR